MITLIWDLKKDLFKAGIYNKSTLEDTKKLKEDLELLQGNIKNPTKKQKMYLKTLMDENEMFLMAKSCLEFILKVVDKSKITYKDKKI